MATKKLTVEVDANTAKAERKLKKLSQTGDGGPGGESSGESAAASAATRSITQLGKASKTASESTRNLVPAFRSLAGVAVGMAASYSQRFMSAGVGRTAMGYAGAILSGAGAGAAVGAHFGGHVGAGVGAVGGAVAGGVGEYLNNGQATEDWFKQFDAAEDALEKTREWTRVFKDMTKVTPDDGSLRGLILLKTQLEDIQKSVANVETARGQARHGESVTLDRIRAIQSGTVQYATEDSKREELESLAAKLADLRGKISDMDAFIESAGQRSNAYKSRIADMELAEKNREGDDEPAASRASMAVDAITRIGGSFGGGDYSSSLLQESRKTNDLLRSIDSKTKASGGDSWQ